MFKKIITMTLSSVLLAPTLAMAKVDSETADQLGNNLTYIGAEKSGNAAGTIPEWKGGYSKQEKRLSHPYKNEKMLYTVDKNNLNQYGNYSLFD